MSRHNYKWSINELLSLQREYELLRLPIQDIAAKHKRTTQAIIHKLIDEELFYMHEEEDEYYYSSDSSGVNDDLYDDEEEDHTQKTIWVTDDEVCVTEDESDDDADVDADDELEPEESVTEKKELPSENDKNVEYIYIHQYVMNMFYNYFFPDKISYRYKLL